MKQPRRVTTSDFKEVINSLCQFSNLGFLVFHFTQESTQVVLHGLCVLSYLIVKDGCDLGVPSRRQRQSASTATPFAPGPSISRAS